jgi:hypothetical protein
MGNEAINSQQRRYSAWRKLTFAEPGITGFGDINFEQSGTK